MILKLRYWLIRILASNMPVILNVNIIRPKGYKGQLIKYPKYELPGMICNCALLGERKDMNIIISPKRDIKVI